MSLTRRPNHGLSALLPTPPAHLQCGEGCADCESPTTCNACSTGLGLVDGKCQKCQLENCASCDEGLATCDFCADPYYLSDATKKCEQARLNRLFDLLSRQTTL